MALQEIDDWEGEELGENRMENHGLDEKIRTTIGGREIGTIRGGRRTDQEDEEEEE